MPQNAISKCQVSITDNMGHVKGAEVVRNGFIGKVKLGLGHRMEGETSINTQDGGEYSR